ncbi:MAG TPA: S8 family serine peptidase [Bryobacteraceae bacterium]|nr:S8 family serine peptidase [Bryobacteraceae bacterium]
MKVAIIDSGVATPHPHIGSIARGVNLCAGDPLDFRDRLGHGTAVMAAIMEKAPDAEFFAVRVFDTSLRTPFDLLARAIEWALDHHADLINLSLGTEGHAADFAPLLHRADRAGSLLIAPSNAIPGSLPGVVAVAADPACPRDEYRTVHVNGRLEFRASPYARPIPGVPLDRNLNGVSFAVANFTGIVARDYHRFVAEFSSEIKSKSRS